MTHAPSNAPSKVVIRSHGKALYFYPTVLAAVVFAILQDTSSAASWGNLFLPLFFANMIVVMFDFTSIRVLIAVLLITLAGLAIWSFGLAAILSQPLDLIAFQMNRHVYAAFAIFFTTLILVDILWAHLHRWEFTANDIRHIQVFAGSTESFAGQNLRFEASTSDVFERLLCGAGTLTLAFGQRKVVLANVPFVHRKAEILDRFVRTQGIFDDTRDAQAGADE
jgi:hypothetical protein